MRELAFVKADIHLRSSAFTAKSVEPDIRLESEPT